MSRMLRGEWLSRYRKPKANKAQVKKTLTCETLEDRRVLATLVGTEADLRMALEGAAPDDCVELTADITLTTGQILIEADSAAGGITIDGAGFTVTGTGADRVFGIDDGDMVADSFTVTFENITITGGGGVSFGGGIASAETLVVNNSTITGNQAIDPAGAYSGTGGGIDSNGTLTLNGTTVSNNTASAIGDIPTTGGGFYLTGLGGGVNAEGPVTIIDSNIDGNDASNRGGGLRIDSVGPHTITNTTIDNNVLGNASYFATPDQSTGGGGLYVDAGAGNAGLQISITGGSISNNIAGATTSAGTGTFDYGGGADFTTRGTTDVVNLDGVTIAGNRSTTDGITAGQTSVQRGVGAAFTAIDGGTFNITDSMVSGNSMTPNSDFPAYGGGLSFATFDGGAGTAYSGVFNVTDTDITDNYGLRGAAFGVRYQGGYYNDGVGAKSIINITGGSITGNSATGDGGGVSWAWLATDITIDGTDVSNNYSPSGGGAFANFKAFAANGLYSTADLTVRNATVSGNRSLTTGGAFDVTTGGLTYAGGIPNDVVVENSTISGNVAYGNGGGFYAYDSNLTVFQSTVSGNTSYGVGGGLNAIIACDPAGTCYTGTDKEAEFIIDRSTFAYNYSGGPGAINFGDNSGFSVTNTLVTDNTSADGIIGGGGTVTPNFQVVNYSLVQNDAAGNAVIAAGTGNQTGVAGGISALADNGGPTMTHAIGMTSPATDAATPGEGAGDTDQRGYGPRDFNGTMDIGAFEFGATDDVTPSPDIDGDGDADCDDIDELTLAIVAGSTDLGKYDFNGDGAVTLADINDATDGWLVAAGDRAEHAAATGGNPFLNGDANLDGVVDGQDFIVWNSNKFGPGTGWCSGDFNADGVVDGPDFIIWNGRKFQDSMTTVGPVVDQGQPDSALSNDFNTSNARNAVEAAGKVDRQSTLKMKDFGGANVRLQNRSLHSNNSVQTETVASTPIAAPAAVVVTASETAGTDQLVGADKVNNAFVGPVLRAQSVSGFDSIANHDDVEEQAADSVFASLGSEL